jgi:hypothetical protein
MRDVVRLACDIDRYSLKFKETKIVLRFLAELVSVASVID